METKIQHSKNIEIATRKEVNLKKWLNVIGLFIFGGLVLTTVTNPLPSSENMEFLLFIFGSAIIYYFLVNIYFISPVWRKVIYATLILLCAFSLFMAFYLATHSTPH